MNDFVFDQLSARADAVRQELTRVRAAPDENAVHDLRVTIRRLFEAVRSLEEYVRPRAARQVRKRLRRVMKAAGLTRNLDIALALAEKARLPLTETEVRPSLQRERAAAAQSLIELLMLLPPEDVTAPCRLQTGRPSAPVLAASILPPMVDRYWKAGEEAVLRHSDWAGLHRFRLATKHLRYTVELFSPVYGARGVAARLAVLRRMQGHLGRINDCESARGLEAVRAHAPLSAWLERLQHDERDRFLEAWAQEAREGAAAQLWLRYFARPLAREGHVLLK